MVDASCSEEEKNTRKRRRRKQGKEKNRRRREGGKKERGETRKGKGEGEGEKREKEKEKEQPPSYKLRFLPHDTTDTRKTSTSLFSIDPVSISSLSEFHCATLQEERYREEGNEVVD